MKGIHGSVFAGAAIAGFSLLGLHACGSVPPPKPPFVIWPPFPDGAGARDSEVDVSPECRIACENLAKIPCPESAPSGRSCGSVCAVKSRHSDLRLLCVANASTPDQVRACCPEGTTGCAPTRCTGR